MFQTRSRKLKAIIKKTLAKIEGGAKFSDALSDYPYVFSSFYINMIRAGELSGTLEENLSHLATQLQKDFELRRRVKSALLYPAVVLVSTFIVGLGVAIFIMPRLATLFRSLKYELPLSTRILIATADFFQKYSYYVAGIIIFLTAFTISSCQFSQSWVG